ncbi:UDP-glcNAc:betaGal beta-1,3-N-acetylglucosaminyltransferase 7 [Clonorchis sinensis]|uniref:Hexosyltransferase n=1 Tax=Clonorchis sinensis TaxID=79923 RepID=G7YRP2_CLOSI|nr:UDP-glcNAc:betaGal beta-1,3-N-acetylglucosaminyltransferase 7 [Clonorchis sinensis]
MNELLEVGLNLCRVKSLWMLFSAGLLLILLCSTRLYYCPQIPLFIRYPGNVDFYKAYESYQQSSYKPDVSLQQWRSNITLITTQVPLCAFAQAPELIILVQTIQTNQNRRNQIRKSWGNADCYIAHNMSAHVLFILGLAPTENTSHPHQLISEEQLEHKDLLQFSFIDSHMNSTRKIATTLSYISLLCPAARFVALFNDDVLVNPRGVVQTLRAVTPLQFPIFFGGHVQNSEPIVRDPTQKRFISYHLYPFGISPRSAAGASLLMSMPVAKLLAFGLHLMPYLPVDDIAIALVLLNLSISPTGLPGVHERNKFFNISKSQKKRFISMQGFGDVRLQSWPRITLNILDGHLLTKTEQDTLINFLLQKKIPLGSLTELKRLDITFQLTW